MSFMHPTVVVLQSRTTFLELSTAPRSFDLFNYDSFVSFRATKYIRYSRLLGWCFPHVDTVSSETLSETLYETL